MKACLLFASSLLFTTIAHSQTGNVGIGTTTPSDQLHTTGTVRFQNYRGPSTRLAQIDSSGRLIVTGAGPTFSDNFTANIPDNGCNSTPNALGLTRSITVSGLPISIQSSKISVRLRIVHPSIAHLRIFLEGPSANRICLVNTNSGGANLTNTIFTDEAQFSIDNVGQSAAPFTGKFKPSGNTTQLCTGQQATVSTFGAMSGGTINPNTTWTLRIYDAYAPVSGYLEGWDISFSGAESFTTTEQNDFIPRFSAGNLVASNLYQDTAGKIGIGNTAPAAGLHVSDYIETLGLLQNKKVLSASSNVFLDFMSGLQYTGRIGTSAIGAGNASLGFFTGVGSTANALTKRLSILNNGNIGIGIADAGITERLHVDSGNIKLGSAQWASGVNDRFIKFGDGEYVTIGETGDDDDMRLTAEDFYFRSAGGATKVGINNPTPAVALDITGALHTTSLADIDGGLTVAGNATFSSPVAVPVLTASGLVTASNGLSVSGNTTMGNVTAAAITAASVSAGSLASTGNASVSGNLTVGSAVSSSTVAASSTVSTPALTVSGNSPAAGKVLTATGNTGATTWQYPPPHNTMVKARNGAAISWYDDTPEVIDTLTEDFDPGNNFNPTTGVYTAPSAGYYQYHFSASGFITEPNNPNANVELYVEIWVNNAKVEEYRVPSSVAGTIVFNKDVTTLLNLSQGATVFTRIRTWKHTYYAAGTAPTNGYIEDGSAVIHCYRIY